MRRSALFAACAAVLTLSAAPASAITYPVYSTPGTENQNHYTFTVANSGSVIGNIVGYFINADASYNDTLQLKVNGNLVAENVFPNHSTDPGASYNFGNFNAGDVLEFLIGVGTGDVFSTDASHNADGVNHVFAAAYSGDSTLGIPAGTLLSFEDIYGGGDFDYNDLTFSFTNLAVSTSAVPEPATWAMMLLGFGLVGGVARSRNGRRAMATAC